MSALRITESSGQHNVYGQPGFNQSAVVIDGLRLCNISSRVTANGINILLRPIEFRLLEFMMRHPGQVYSRTELLAYVWKSNVCVGERTIDVHIRRIRSSLKPFGMDAWIRTIHTRGYRFSTQY